MHSTQAMTLEPRNGLIEYIQIKMIIDTSCKNTATTACHALIWQRINPTEYIHGQPLLLH
jgi:hypothetical protein